MAAFSRSDYIKLFQIGCDLWRLNPGTGDKALTHRMCAVEIMDLCEQVLGQLHRPDRKGQSGGA